MNLRCSRAAWLLAFAGLVLLARSARAQSGGDYNGDGDVDGTDFWYWSGCMTGPAGEGPDPNCAAFDFDGGPARAGTVDLADFTAFGRVFATRKVPLGGSVTAYGNPARLRVCVPTKWGGVLTVYASPSGDISALKYPDGSPFTNGTETGENKQGWGTFDVTGAGAYQVYAVFSQTGQATTRPWNFYYWPKKGEYIAEPPAGNGVADTTALATDVQIVPPGSPVDPGDDIVRCGTDGNLETSPVPDDVEVHLYALYRRIDPWRPLDKYEQVNGGYPRNWEAQYDQSDDDWAGHCLGATMASILKNQSTPAGGTPFLQDEVEALWAELGENGAPGAWVMQPGHWVDGIPPGPPVPGYDDTDEWVSLLHARFEECIRHEHVALASNLRAAAQMDPAQVWNHAIWKYSAVYSEAAGGDETAVHVVNELRANDDILPPSTGVADRTVTYTYEVQYSSTGEVLPGIGDFINGGGLALFAPGAVYHVLSGIWDAQNPYVLLGEVEADDGAN